MFPKEISKCGRCYTLYVHTVTMRQSHISNLRLSRHILIKYEFNSVTIFVSKEKITFSIKLDENYDCVFKIMSGTKITSGEFIENMLFSLSNASMHTCSNVWFK